MEIFNSPDMEYMEIKNIVEKYDRSKQKIISMLHEAQKLNGENYITEEQASCFSKELAVPLSKIYDILTFHSMFESKPRGRFVIEVCNSAPCRVRNYKEVASVLEDILSIKIGETTEDRMFTLQKTSCIGACDISPAMKIGDNVYGNLTKQKISEIISEYMEGKHE